MLEPGAHALARLLACTGDQLLLGSRAAVERFIAVGASKFVLVPVVEPEDWTAHLADVGDATLDLVT